MPGDGDLGFHGPQFFAGSGVYAAGTHVTIQATPNSGWNFTGWSGACSGTGSSGVAMDADKSVTASFTKAATNLDSYVSPDGKWSISYLKGFGVNIQPDGYTVFGHYPSVQVIYTEGAGAQYDLNSWTDFSLLERASNRQTFEVLSRRRVTVGGYPADEVVFFSYYAQFESNDADIVLYLLIGGDGYAIDALSPQEGWNINLPILTESIYTFRSPPRSP